MFICGFCCCRKSLEDLAVLPCSCLMCQNCSRKELERQIDRPHNGADPSFDPPSLKQPLPGKIFELGQTVLYITRQEDYIEAVIKVVDNSVQPPQYGIQLAGRDELRYTEEHRLVSTAPRKTPPSPHYTRRSQPLSAHCPMCHIAVDMPYLRLLAPKAVGDWEAERTAAWMRVHDIISCPRCGVSIQRVGPNGVSHRERHRYRCGACQGDFCDSCMAVPYHENLTCRQAHMPDCLLCGSKVNEDRLDQLLPNATAAMAEEGMDVKANVAGGEGEASNKATAVALTVVQHASRPELRRALKALNLNATWCLERHDLEKAFMHWGCKTCSSQECAARLAAMCARPLPCGHWCCGLRGEGEAASGSSQQQPNGHPRCVECGCDPRLRSPIRGGVAEAVTGLVKACCFCWEPLSTAPCIEMACGPRHMCHLHCARARLAAGYPGPHISFTHLYCPLCRDARNDNLTAAAAGTSTGSSGVVQAALAQVHLDHPALQSDLKPHLALRAEVVAAARARIRVDPALRTDPELRPGGLYDGRPADYGLERLMFYKCSRCVKVYYGGQRACGAAAQAEPLRQRRGGAPADGGREGAAADQVLLCGECCARASGTNCPQHGTKYIEWKCRYCCRLATWFCYGTTHMCEPCHSKVATGTLDVTVAVGDADICTNPSCGLKGIPHPPPGAEACLGCGMCRVGQ